MVSLATTGRHTTLMILLKRRKFASLLESADSNSCRIEETIIQMILNTFSTWNPAIGIGNQPRRHRVFRPDAEEPSSSRTRRPSDEAVLSSETHQPVYQLNTVVKDGKVMVKRRAGKRPESEPLWDLSGKVPMNHAAREVARLRALTAEDEEEDGRRVRSV
jgi:hypothetical protein